MTELRVTDSFIESVRQITSEQIRRRLESLVELVGEVPAVGSKLNRSWLKDEYGGQVLTLDLKPFLLVYEYNEEKNTVVLHGIVYQRQVK